LSDQPRQRRHRTSGQPNIFGPGVRQLQDTGHRPPPSSVTVPAPPSTSMRSPSLM
jgi:hypothetical protein